MNTTDTEIYRLLSDNYLKYYNDNVKNHKLAIAQLLSCSRTIHHRSVVDSFIIDTTRYEEGSVMTIIPRDGEDIFGTMIDIGDTTNNNIAP